MENVINMDAYLIEFVTHNYLSITVILTVLKGLAKTTPWAWDDSIVSLFAGAFTAFKNRNIEKAKNNKNV